MDERKLNVDGRKQWCFPRTEHHSHWEASRRISYCTLRGCLAASSLCAGHSKTQKIIWEKQVALMQNGYIYYKLISLSSLLQDIFVWWFWVSFYDSDLPLVWRCCLGNKYLNKLTHITAAFVLYFTLDLTGERPDNKNKINKVKFVPSLKFPSVEIHENVVVDTFFTDWKENSPHTWMKRREQTNTHKHITDSPQQIMCIMRIHTTRNTVQHISICHLLTTTVLLSSI